MGLIAKDLPSLVYMLLPGFMAAGVFYTLTAHPKSSEFERLIQALIFTVLLKIATWIVWEILTALGDLISLGRWNDNVELAWSVILALPMGLGFAYSTNRDIFHRQMRKLGITTRTSYPSEWYGTFAREKRYVILHLEGRRRIYGWPEEWPDQPDKGQFVRREPEWILDDNQRAPLYTMLRFMIPASDVKWVEFLKEPKEVSADLSELERVEHLLIDAQKEKGDGSESPPAAANPSS